MRHEFLKQKSPVEYTELAMNISAAMAIMTVVAAMAILLYSVFTW